jgi:hypothetical protein
MRFYVVAAVGLASPCCGYQQLGWQLAAPSRFITRTHFAQCHRPAERCRRPGLHAVCMNAELAAAASKLGGTLVVAGSLALKVS